MIFDILKTIWAHAKGGAARTPSAKLGAQAGLGTTSGVRCGPPALKRPTDTDYLYRCEVVRVVDGDTLLVEIDLGFGVHKEERLRLLGVDAAEAKTRAGKKAAQWVRERLAAAEQVVMKTVKIEMHGRYVAHVFYGGDAEAAIEGVFRSGGYLNAELIAQGLAKRAD